MHICLQPLDPQPDLYFPYFPIIFPCFFVHSCHSLPVVLRSCEDCEIAGAPPPVPCNVTSVDVTIPFSGKATVTTSRVQYLDGSHHGGSSRSAVFLLE